MVSVFPYFRAEGEELGATLFLYSHVSGLLVRSRMLFRSRPLGPHEQKLFPSPAAAPSDALTLEAQVLTCCFSNRTLWFSLPGASAIPPFLSLKSFGSL